MNLKEKGSEKFTGVKKYNSPKILKKSSASSVHSIFQANINITDPHSLSVQTLVELVNIRIVGKVALGLHDHKQIVIVDRAVLQRKYI